MSDWFLEYFNDRLNPFNMDLNRFTRGMVDSGMNTAFTPEERNRWQYEVSKFPIVGDYYRWRDLDAFFADYMRNRDLSWADMKYPSMAQGSGTSSGAVTKYLALNPQISHSIGSLYDELEAPRHRSFF